MSAPTPRVKLAELLEEHRLDEWHSGNGYTEPNERGIGCTCGLVYSQYVQHRCEDDCPCRDVDDKELPEIADEHLRHVLAILIRERMLTTSRLGESVTNPPFDFTRISLDTSEGMPF